MIVNLFVSRTKNRCTSNTNAKRLTPYSRRREIAINPVMRYQHYLQAAKQSLKPLLQNAFLGLLSCSIHTSIRAHSRQHELNEIVCIWNNSPTVDRAPSLPSVVDDRLTTTTQLWLSCNRVTVEAAPLMGSGIPMESFIEYQRIAVAEHFKCRACALETCVHPKKCSRFNSSSLLGQPGLI